MRVGLFRLVAPEVIGGGYTIEHEIFERLLECAPTSKHEFVVFEDLDGDKATGKTPNLKETPRKHPFSAKQLYAKLRSISRTANSVPRPISPHHVWLISAELASFIGSLVYVARFFSTSTRPVLRSRKRLRMTLSSLGASPIPCKIIGSKEYRRVPNLNFARRSPRQVAAGLSKTIHKSLMAASNQR
jgi:hypothetical protein